MGFFLNHYKDRPDRLQRTVQLGMRTGVPRRRQPRPLLHLRVKPPIQASITKFTAYSGHFFVAISHTDMCQQTSTACTPVDIEWLPSNSSAGLSMHLGADEKQNTGCPDIAFDDSDPFANWPPKPSNSASSLGSLSQSHGISSNTSSTGFGSNSSPTGRSKPYPGSLVSNTNNLSGLGLTSHIPSRLNIGNSGLSVGNLISTLGMEYNNSSVGQSAGKTTEDLESLFA